ncbi:MAG: hypothetical protein HYY16_10210 [Planctomycetes bacterium]|nr:hypothetical protein [Planctomycetota bacterium]
MAGQLIGTVVPRDLLDRATTERLYELFRSYYLCVDRRTFDRDQAEKDWVLLLRDIRGLVVGFTTMKLYDLSIQGRRVRAVFSGNTIVDRECWGEQELARTWFDFMVSLKSREPAVPLYWYLICSGYRTYLYLPLFYKDFSPRANRPTSPFVQTLIDTLGRMRYPEEYREGIIRVAQPREVLRPDLAIPSESKLQNPHVRFFVERNPGYVRGDELVCMAEFSIKNLLRAAHREVLEAAVRRASSAA